MCRGSAPAKPGQVQTLATNNSLSYTHGSRRIPPPVIPRRDKPQVAGDLRHHLDTRDHRQKAVQAHQEEGKALQPQGRPRSQGTGLSTTEDEHVGRSAEGTKFGYRTSNGPLPASKLAAESTNAASSNGALSRPQRASPNSGSSGTETHNGGKGRKQSFIPLPGRKTGTFTSARVHRAEQYKRLQLLVVFIRHQHLIQLLLL